MSTIIDKFEQYKNEFLESYTEKDYQKYRDSCYKIFILYVENIIINANFKLEEIDYVFDNLIIKFNDEAFIKYIEFNQIGKKSKNEWNWFLEQEFESLNLSCSDISKTILAMITNPNIVLSIIMDEIKNIEDLSMQSITRWESSLIPTKQSFYWNN